MAFYTVSCGTILLMFRRNTLPPSPGLMITPRKLTAKCLSVTCQALFDNDGNRKFLRNVGKHLQDYTAHLLTKRAEHCGFAVWYSARDVYLIDYIVTGLINALPGNSSVNTVQHTRAVNNKVEVFSM
jgi:hypothetical protein